MNDALDIKPVTYLIKPIQTGDLQAALIMAQRFKVDNETEINTAELTDIVDDFIFKKIPLSEFETGIFSISRENKIVLFCHSGKRSLQAMEILKSNFPEVEAYSLKGGILAWEKFKKMNNE